LDFQIREAHGVIIKKLGRKSLNILQWGKLSSNCGCILCTKQLKG
jgi:hypothetical protein